MIGTKYYSDMVPGKSFDTEAECKAAEKKAKEEAEINDETATTNEQTKKQRAKEVEDAKAAVTDAKNEYREALTEVDRIYEQANKNIRAIREECEANIAKEREYAKEAAYGYISPRAQKVKDAEEKYREILLNYCDDFGVYKTYYTGRDAEREFEKMQKDLWHPLELLFADKLGFSSDFMKKFL